MKQIWTKRMARDLRANLMRYLALGLLIALSMYLVVSMIGAAETIIRGSQASDAELQVEDGEFSVFVPLRDTQKERLAGEGVLLEDLFSMDYTYGDRQVLRVFADRQQIDLIRLTKGSLPEGEQDVVVERRFAEENDIATGDSISLGGRTFRVSGIGIVPDYNNVLKTVGDTGSDCKNFGLAFVSGETYAAMRREKKSVKTEEYTYAYRLGDGMTHRKLKEQLEKMKFSANDVEDPFFKEYWDRTAGRLEDPIVKGILTLMQGSGGFDGDLDDLLQTDTSNLMTFLKAGDNARIQAASGDEELYRSVGMIAGAVLLILISYVLSVFVVHSIDRESQVIGALYALGIKRRSLMFQYVMLPTAVAFLGGLAGTLLGYSRWGVPVQMQDCYAYYSLPDLDVIVMPYLFVYGIVVPVVISVLVNVLVIRKRLNQPVLSLLRNEKKSRSATGKQIGSMQFIRLFRIRQMLRETRTEFTVVFGVFVSLLLAMMSLEIYAYCDSVNTEYVQDTKYEYMYTYKYPEKKAPEGGYAAYAKGLKKEIYGYTFDVTVLGIQDDNPFFDVDLQNSSTKVAVSSSIAYKYGLKVGDTLTLTDEEEDKLYAFEISGITQYAPSFMVFMPYKKALKLFGESDDYYNVVFSDHALDIESGRLYSTVSRQDVKKAAGIFSDMMRSMIILLGAVSVLIFAVVLYLMMKVMIDRSSFHIALMKIFGFRDKEVKKMYLDANFYIIALGAAVSIPLAKWIMDAAYEPAFVPNIACGVDKSFPWWMYVAVYAVILLLYGVINRVLMGRIRQMTPTEVLKNRE